MRDQLGFRRLPAFWGRLRLRDIPAESPEESAWVPDVEVEQRALDPERLLLQCEGYLVDGSDGREIGVVDRVETTGEPPVASSLLIAAGWFGRRRLRVDATAVEALRPAERRVIVDESRVTSALGENRA